MKYADVINQALEDSANPEKRSLLVEATIAFYLELKAKMESGDPAKRKEAQQEAMEIQALLIAHRNQMCDQLKLSPEQFTKLCAHPMFAGQNQAVEEARARVENAIAAHPPKMRRFSDNRQSLTPKA
jgi:hypothetical protein